jgi:hypothetical protein
MGDCDSGERICMRLPLETIRTASKDGGSVAIRWTNDDDVGLLVQTKATTEETANQVDDNDAQESTTKKARLDSETGIDSLTAY